MTIFQRPREKIEEPFKDKKPHLYTLVVRPDNTYDISIDQEVSEASVSGLVMHGRGDIW